MGVATMHAEPGRIAKNIAEHTEILDALRGGDARSASGLVERHVSWVKFLARMES
jgi:DNA-binding GntR family transcriptional regulator